MLRDSFCRARSCAEAIEAERLKRLWLKECKPIFMKKEQQLKWRNRLLNQLVKWILTGICLLWNLIVSALWLDGERQRKSLHSREDLKWPRLSVAGLGFFIRRSTHSENGILLFGFVGTIIEIVVLYIWSSYMAGKSIFDKLWKGIA